VPEEQIVKAYGDREGAVHRDHRRGVEAIAIESMRTIEIDTFVPRKEIDELYNVRPYYIAPDGKVGQDAFAVIRQVIEEMKMVAIARLVLTTREQIVALEPRGKGTMGTLLRFPYEIRDERNYFGDTRNITLNKDALGLARHIAQTKSGHFHPSNLRTITKRRFTS
jgi:DNA end-binding protein Ku